MTQAELKMLRNGDIIKINGTDFGFVYDICGSTIYITKLSKHFEYVSQPYTNLQDLSDYTIMSKSAAKLSPLYEIFKPKTKCHVCPNNQYFLWAEYVELNGDEISIMYEDWDDFNFVVECCYLIQNQFYVILIEPSKDLRAIVKASSVVPDNFPIGIQIVVKNKPGLKLLAKNECGITSQQAESLIKLINDKNPEIENYNQDNGGCLISIDGYKLNVPAFYLRPSRTDFANVMVEQVFGK